MKYFFTLLALLFVVSVTGQQNKYISAAVVSTQTDYPFGKFAALIGRPLHPGIEFGYGKNINAKTNKEWFLELRLGYFFHRFVQHGIPVTVNFGYRHRVGNHFTFQASLGGGYMQSIPATGKFKLDDNGEYQRNKGAGRMQAVASFSLGAGYTIKPKAQIPYTVFSRYEQRLQFPFIKSYVPLLPYNSFHLGVQRPLHKKG
jgi:hypothetical protein